MTPSVVAPGSSPSFEVVYTVTSAVSLDPSRGNIWDVGVGFNGVSIPADLSVPAVADTATGVIS